MFSFPALTEWKSWADLQVTLSGWFGLAWGIEALAFVEGKRQTANKKRGAL